MYNPKYRKGQHKESKEARKSRNKQSFARKFDPDLAETTRQTQKRLKVEEDKELDDSDDSDGDDVDVDVDNGHANESESNSGNGDDHQQPNEIETTDKTNEKLQYQSRIEVLRAKLRAKLDAKRTNNHNTEDASAQVSKRAARKADKIRRIEAAKKKNAGGSTQTMRNGKGRPGVDADKSSVDLGGSKVLSLAEKGNDLDTIDYGGITGLKADIGSNYVDSNKSLKNMGKKKNLEHLLALATANKEKLEKLKASENLDDKERAKKVEWSNTLKAASGDRNSKNDPALLKKAIKRQAKKKGKSQAAWKTRMNQVKDKMDERQKIRQHNIGKRKLGGAAGANLSKKKINDEDGNGADSKDKVGENGKKRPRLGPHSGKARAGFEGKKQDFINKGGKSGGETKVQ